jgi:hypothetical protein
MVLVTPSLIRRSENRPLRENLPDLVKLVPRQISRILDKLVPGWLVHFHQILDSWIWDGFLGSRRIRHGVGVVRGLGLGGSVFAQGLKIIVVRGILWFAMTRSMRSIL